MGCAVALLVAHVGLDAQQGGGGRARQGGQAADGADGAGARRM
jgi:hypothetical protein